MKIPRAEARVRYKLDELGFVEFVRVETAAMPLKLHWIEVPADIPLVWAPTALALEPGYAPGTARRLIAERHRVEGFVDDLRAIGMDT